MKSATTYLSHGSLCLWYHYGGRDSMLLFHPSSFIAPYTWIREKFIISFFTLCIYCSFLFCWMLSPLKSANKNHINENQNNDCSYATTRDRRNVPYIDICTYEMIQFSPIEVCIFPNSLKFKYSERMEVEKMKIQDRGRCTMFNFPLKKKSYYWVRNTCALALCVNWFLKMIFRWCR